MLQATVSKTVFVTAGGLSEALTSIELATVIDITITGTIDSRDFVTLRDQATALTIINLSEANVVAYNGTLGTSGTKSTSNSVNTIPTEAFKNCKRLTSVNIPAYVTSIGVGAFYSCSGLTTIVIPSTVISIDEVAFGVCSGKF